MESTERGFAYNSWFESALYYTWKSLMPSSVLLPMYKFRKMKWLNYPICSYTAWDLYPTWICSFSNNGFFYLKLLILNLLVPWSFLILKRALIKSLLSIMVSPSKFFGEAYWLGGDEKIGWTLLYLRFEALDRLNPSPLTLRFFGLLLTVLLTGFFLAIYFSLYKSTKFN